MPSESQPAPSPTVPQTETGADVPTLEKLAEVARALCEGRGADWLERTARMACRLPGITGLTIDLGGEVVRAGVAEGPSARLPLGNDPSEGHVVVHGDAARTDSAARGALDIVVLVLSGVLSQRRTTSILAEREEASRAAVDTALDAVVRMDAQGLIREFNPAAERIFGYRRRDVLGRPLADVLVPERLRAAHWAGLARYLRTRHSEMLGHRIEMPAVCADGREITVELAITPTAADERLGFTGFLRDVTRARDTQRRLEETTSRLRTLIASLHAGVLMEDEQRRIVVTNRAFTDIFGIQAEPEALLGADCSRAAEESKHVFADPEGFVASVEARLAERRLTTEEELTMADGRVLERDFVPVFREEEYLGHLWLYRDITDRKQAERRMVEQNRMLADVARTKDRFVATVSHELRTPLTAVIGFVEILGRQETGPLSDEQRTYLDVIERNANLLLRLGDDLLTLISAESEGLRLVVAPFDAADVVRAVVVDQGRRAAERGVRIEAFAPQHVAAEGDAARLRQVFGNLVGNAVKYTPRGGEVIATVDVEDGFWRVEVRDTGIGIPEADQERLFTSFFRASNTRAGVTPGTGLGLVISRAIVELHQGTIDIASEQGKGTTVTVTLPLQVPAEVEGAS